MENTKNSGISISMIVFIVFLILKLTNTIDWSWWWVTCPLWIGVVLFIVFLVIAGIIAFISEVVR
jgi:hypothetical protein